MRLRASDTVGTGEFWEVIDLDTGQPIDGVEWADDAAGAYSQARMNADGSFIVETEPGGHRGLVFDLKRGNIQLRHSKA